MPKIRLDPIHQNGLLSNSGSTIIHVSMILGKSVMGSGIRSDRIILE